jgi:hypothetical protein
MNNILIAQTESVLHQLTEVLNQLEHSEYIRPIESLSESSLGQHVRHVIEFYQCMTLGYSRAKINYEGRKRDKMIEESREFAAQCISKILFDIKNLDQKKPLVLEVQYEDNHHLEIATTIEREMVYNIEHAIHHMALIKVGIKEINNRIKLPAEFGVAASTIRYQQNHVHRNVFAKN